MSVGSSLGLGKRRGSFAQRLRSLRGSTGITGSSAPLLRLLGLVLVASALVLAFASAAFAARPYQSQLTEANGTPFSNPFGLAVDGSDNLWVSDTGASLVSKFDSTGSFLAQTDGTGSWGSSVFVQDLAFSNNASLVYAVDSNFDDLWGLNLDTTFASVDLTGAWGSGCCFIRADVDNSGNANDGDVYVSSNNGSVTRVDGSGAASDFTGSASYISANQLTGTPDHSFGNLEGIAVDANGDVYVLDRDNSEIDRFDSTGTFVQTYTGSFGALSSVAVDPTNGNVLIGDDGQGVVHELDSSGADVGDIDGSDTPGGSFTPQGLAVDSTGRLYVSDGAHAVVDVFGPTAVTHTLSVSKSGGSGTVTSSPAGIACGGTCSAEFNDNSTVTLTATPSAHFTFTGWTVDGDDTACPGTGTCDVPMGTADHAVVAHFAAITHTLTVSKAGTGDGTVTSSPAGINCGTTCAASFTEGSTVTLTASAVAGSTFTGWSGPGAASCPGTGTCSVAISADTSVTATFDQNKPTVTTTTGATGITQHAATVAGTVNPNSGNVTNCHIEYGTSTSYGSQAPCSPASVGGGASAVGVSAALSGLTANTTYHFRVVATNAGGTTNGADQTFKTLADTCQTNAALCPAPPPPTCATDPSLCPKAPGVLKLDVAVAIVTGGKAAVKLSCKGETACSDTLKLTAKVKVRKGRKTVTKTVTLGKASVDVAAGASETVKIRLNRTARKLLAKKHRLKARLVGSDLKHAIVLKEKKRKK